MCGLTENFDHESWFHETSPKYAKKIGEAVDIVGDRIT